MIFRFHNPWFLLLILLWLIVYFERIRRSHRHVFVYSSLAEFKQIPRTFASMIKPYVHGAIGLGILLLIIALARPQKGREDFRVRSEGISIAMCLDRSGSMQAMDFFIDKKRVNRLEVVKQVFRDFVLGNDSFPGRPDDRIALIGFGGYVDSWCPLTLDHSALAEMIAMLECPKPIYDQHGRIVRNKILDQESATAIGDALLSAIDRLKEVKTGGKVIILLSDGAQNTGVVTAEEAAKVAREQGIRIYAIGIGTNEPVPVPEYGPNGEQTFTRAILELDEASLKKIADTTNGKYFHVKDTDALKKVCDEINTLERTVYEDRVFTKYMELYRYFLWPGLVLICIGLSLVYTRFRQNP